MEWIKAKVRVNPYGMEKRDVGKIKKVGHDLYVIPEKLPFPMLELHPEDVKLFRRGNCLTPIKGLRVEFELSYVRKIRNHGTKEDHHVYALIVGV